MINKLRRSGVSDIIDHNFTILADFITLPQLVIHLFVRCMMPERTIAVVPNGGSLKERIWLTYMDKVNERAEGVDFVPMISRYCSGRGQHRVGSFYFDGYREMPNEHRDCFEFYGCYYHGCTMCFPDRSKVVRCKRRENGYLTVEKAYIDTMDTEKIIKHLINFDENVDRWIVMREHDYNNKESIMKDELGEQATYGLVGKMNP